MYDAEFLDENTIFALYLEDGMRMSHDGGKTWRRMFAESGGIPKGSGYSPHTLEFLYQSTGWAAGSSLISTRDGGQTWQNIRVPEWMDSLKVKFLNENVGYVAGRGGYCERGTGRCKLWMGVYKTTDGGRTWKKSFRTRENTTPWDIVIVDESIAMITADSGWLYRTDNGGRSWKPVLDKDYHHVMSISRAPDGCYWLFGTSSIRVSDDLGLTWKKAENIDEGIVNHEWWSVDFTEDGLGVAVSEEAAIALTRDGGRSWKQVTSNLHTRVSCRCQAVRFIARCTMTRYGA